MKWIGITGGIGVGKSSVCKIITEKKLPTIEADNIIRKTLLQDHEVQNDIINVFGKEILDHEGQLDRKKVASAAFSNKAKLSELEQIIHPKLANLVKLKRDLLKKKGYKIAFYEAPLLFEKQMQDQFDEIILVAAKENLVIKRLLKRGLEKNDILLRMKHQLPQKDKLALVSYVIWNNSSLYDLKKACCKVLTDITKTNDKQ